MVEPEIVKQLRVLSALGWGARRVAPELGIARSSVCRYLREGAAAETQTWPGAWTLDAERRSTARELLDGVGVTAFVQRLLAEHVADAAACARATSSGQAHRRARDRAIRGGAWSPNADRFRRAMDPDRRRAGLFHPIAVSTHAATAHAEETRPELHRGCCRTDYPAASGR